MGMGDFQMMVEDSHVDTRIIEYRLKPGPNACEQLVACCLTDRLSDGLSMVYSFYDPDLAGHSLGAFMILDHVMRAASEGLPHLYLGYFVSESRKMSYKAHYLPQERLGLDGWSRFDAKEDGDVNEALTIKCQFTSR